MEAPEAACSEFLPFRSPTSRFAMQCKNQSEFLNYYQPQISLETGQVYRRGGPGPLADIRSGV